MLCSVFNNYSTSARWIWVGYNHFISNKHEWNNCFIKKLPKNQPILILFSILSRRVQLPYLEIAWYSGSYTMMANPIRALELHYLMIQFLIKIHIYQTSGALPIIIGVALDFLKVVRLVFWSGVVGPGTNFRWLALRARSLALARSRFVLTVALSAQKLDLWASLGWLCQKGIRFSGSRYMNG